MPSRPQTRRETPPHGHSGAEASDCEPGIHSHRGYGFRVPDLPEPEGLGEGSRSRVLRMAGEDRAQRRRTETVGRPSAAEASIRDRSRLVSGE